VKIFFDNCTSPVLADVLDALVRAEGSSAHHIRFMAEYGFDARTTDIEWIEGLSARRTEDWIVISEDARIRKVAAERLAWRKAQLKGFVFAAGYQKMPLNQRASNLIWRWPQMKVFISAAAQGSVFELPVQRSAGFRPLTV
jgi:PIN like domain